MIKKLFFTLLAILSQFGFFATKVFAQAPENLGGNALANSNLGTRDIVGIVSTLINVFLGFLGIIAVILIIYAGWLWMSSQGEADKIQKAKLILTSSVIGLIIILSSYAIARFVISKISEATGGPGSGTTTIVDPPPTLIPTCPAPADPNEVKICNVKPIGDTATVGQYITIEGWNFGEYNSVLSEVKFDDEIAELVSCGGVVRWQEYDAGYYRVKVAVPNIALGDYKINIFAASGVSDVYPDGASDFFEIVAGSPRPSIGCITPAESMRAGTVDIEGVGFGSGGAIQMSGWVSGARADISFDSPASWSDTFISDAQIRQEALSSDITVTVGGEESNPEWFKVLCNDGGVDCASNCCAAHSCVEAGACLVAAVLDDGPIISSISGDTGKEGNLITIYGTNFGDDEGSVVFENNSGGEVSGIAPREESSVCTTYWSDTMILVIVPENVKDATAVSGAKVWVRDAENKDSNFKVFYDNGYQLPGLCLVDPASGSFEEDLTLYGIQFASGDKTSFGGILSTNNFTSINEATVKVPNVSAGELAVWIQDADGRAGNTLPFTVNGLAGGDPVIQDLSPDNGPEGQYVTIFGANFGNEAGIVNFSRGGVDVPADLSFPAQCSANYWRHNSIVVKVPDLAGPATDYKVTVKRSADAKVSNAKDFNNILGTPGPGLCALLPNNGPANDVFVVSLFGDNFGSSQAAGDSVKFSSGAGNLTANINTWSSQSVVARTPLGASSGQVTLENNTIASNALNFEVNTCSNDTQCGAGRECCVQASGNYCGAAGSCPGSTSCHYSWSITTKAEPFELRQTYQCSVDLQSPSPWPDGMIDPIDLAAHPSREAYVDANITALFTRDVVDSDFNTTNIQLLACNTTSEFDGSACSTAVVGDISLINHNSNSEGFAFNPSVNLEPERWYKVVLGTFHSEVGNDVWTGSSFAWHFKTQNASCQPNNIMVTPQGTSADFYVSQEKDFYAFPRADCQVCGSDFTWSAWSLPVSGDNLRASIEAQYTVTVNPAHVILKGLQATENSTPSYITLKAELNGLQSTTNPKIKDAILNTLDYGPNCNQSCVNAAVWVLFNTELDVSTVNATNISINKCSDENCNSLVGPNLISSFVINAAGDRVLFNHTDFLPSTSYMVQITSNVKNIAGYNLNPALKWKFKTNSDANCKVDRVEVDPSYYLSHTISENIPYLAEAYSAANACDGAGQLLDAEDYSWSWTAAPSSFTVISATSNPQTTVRTIADGETNIKAQISSAPANDPGAVGKSNFGHLEINQGSGGSVVYPAPLISSHKPITPACLNSAMTVEFDQKMDRASLESNVKLYKRSAVDNGSCLPLSDEAEAEAKLTPWESFKNFLTFKAKAQATLYYLCPVSGTYSIFDRGVGTKLVFYPNENLSPNTRYFGTVYPGAKSIHDVNLNSSQINYDFDHDGANDFYAWTFDTYDQVCRVSFVTVEKNPDLFTCSHNNCANDRNTSMDGNQHEFSAQAFDPSGQVLNMDEYNWSENKDLLDLVTDDDQTILATAVNENGTTNIHVAVSDDAAGEAVGSARVDLFMCENPWPKLNPGPFPYNFSDSLYNFETYYCQDFGESGTTLLPYLPENPIYHGANGMTLEEFIFVVDPQVVAVVNDESITQKISWWQKILDKFKVKALAEALPEAPPAAPTGLFLASNDSAGVVLKWADNSSNEDGFRVYRKTSASDWSEIGTVAMDIEGFTDTGVVADEIYSYKVLAFNGSINSNFTNVITVTAMASGSDVIGVRVMSNNEHLSVKDWYKKYAPNATNSGQELQVDGYQALKVGNTVYVAAANLDKDHNKIYTNIYIISHNIGARQSTQAIFNAMVQNLHLSNNVGSNNYCAADPTRSCESMFDCADLASPICDAAGLQLRRDTQRLSDLMSIKKQLDFYGQIHKACSTNANISCTSDTQCPNGGHCLPYYPLLNSGTYVNGMAVSKWPSWQAEFAQTIGMQTIGQDPINEFTGCNGYNDETCWNESNNAFYCPKDSLLYLYKKEAGVNDYSLDANFEFDAGGITFGNIEPAVDSKIQFNNNQYCNSVPTDDSFVTSPDCGNGIIDGSEECDGGFQNLCDANLYNVNWWNEQLGGCYPPGSMNAAGDSIECTWYEPNPALTPQMCGGACGDTTLDRPYELCERSDAAGVIDFGGLIYTCADGSTPSCDTCMPVCDDGSLANACGDHIWNASNGEQCDASASPNGLAGFGCTEGGVVSCNTCRVSCSAGTLYEGSCNDGNVDDPSESCEPMSYIEPATLAASSASLQYACGEEGTSQACRVTGGWCGDGTIQNSFGEICDVLSYITPSPALARETNQYDCNDNCALTGGWCGDGAVQSDFGEFCENGSQTCLVAGYNGTQNCNSSSCSWNTCVTGEYCGDHIVNGPEDCDGPTASCVDAGFIAGQASCSSCSITDTAACCSINGLNAKFLADDSFQLFVNGVLKKSGSTWDDCSSGAGLPDDLGACEFNTSAGDVDLTNDRNVIAFYAHNISGQKGVIGSFSCQEMTCKSICYKGTNAGGICTTNAQCTGGGTCIHPASGKEGDTCSTNQECGPYVSGGGSPTGDWQHKPSLCLPDDFGITTKATGGLWKCTDTQPIGAWNSDPNYNITGWNDVVASHPGGAWDSSVHPSYWKHMIPGAASIWSGSGDDIWCRYVIEPAV